MPSGVGSKWKDIGEATGDGSMGPKGSVEVRRFRVIFRPADWVKMAAAAPGAREKLQGDVAAGARATPNDGDLTNVAFGVGTAVCKPSSRAGVGVGKRIVRVICGAAVEVALGTATGALAATGVIVALSVPAPQAANSVKRQLVASRYSFGFAEKIAGSCNRTVRTHGRRKTMP
jgi:hypothetical protein